MSMLDFKVLARTEGDIAVIAVEGNVDTENFTFLKNKIEDLFINKKFKIMIDLGKVPFMSSAGWGIIAGSVKKAKSHGGDIKLINLSEKVKISYDVLELRGVVKNYETFEEAREGF